MPDDAIRALEREVLAEPHDARARARLALALLRSGRSADATRAAMLDRELEDDAYLALLDLAERAWTAEVLLFDKDVAIPGARDVGDFHGTSETGPFCAWTDSDHKLTVARTDTGAIVVADRRRAGEVAFADRSCFFTDVDRGRIVELDLASGREIEERAIQRLRCLRAVSPKGDLILLTGGNDGVYRWPSLEVVLEELAGPAAPVAHWARGELVLSRPGDGAVELIALDGKSPRRALETRPQTRRRPSEFDWRARGDVLLEASDSVLALHDLARATKIDLAPYAKLIRAACLTDDERRVRAVVDRFAQRLVIRRDGAILRDERGARVPDGDLMWHPIAELAIVQPQDGAAHEVRSLDGKIVRRFPLDAKPYAWTPDGRGVILGRAGPGDRVLVEIWRRSRAP